MCSVLFFAAPTCDQLLPPKNGMMLIYGAIAFPSCPRGVYPSENFPTFYSCRGGVWAGMPMSPVKKLVPDCIGKLQIFTTLYIDLLPA